MQPNSKDEISKDKETPEEGSEDFNPQLGDVDDDIIDLVDVFEEETAGSDEITPRQEGQTEVADEQDELTVGDLDLHDELAADEVDIGAPYEAPEDKEQYEPDLMETGESEMDDMFAQEESTSDTLVFEPDELDASDGQISDEALAELFSSHETEVAQLLQEDADTNGEPDTPVADESSTVDRGLPEELLDQFSVEPELVAEEPLSEEDLPAAEEDLPADLFTHLETESDTLASEALIVDESSATEEELPGDVYVDLGAESTEVSAEADVPVETEANEVITPAMAEELADLLSAHVEEVVTRLVAEQLPAIVERVVAEEIEKIKATLESGD